MSNKSLPEKEFRFTGWHMAACMFAFFGVIIGVNLFMAFTASSSWTGLVVKNSYVASQQFNRDLEAAKIQKAAGWKSTLSYRDGLLSVRLEDRDGIPLALSNATLAFGRPAHEQQDNKIMLQPSGAGVHSSELNLNPGEWFVKVTGDVDGKTYRRDARLIVDQNFSGELQ